MADINITGGGMVVGAVARAPHVLVMTSASNGYMFFPESTGATLIYTKTTDGGANWGSNVTIAAPGTAPILYDVWFDKWTPGDSGTTIHIWYSDVTTDDLFYRSLDTSSDTLGTERTVFTGASAAQSRGAFVSGTKTRSGYLYAAFSIDAGTERGLFRSTDGGTSWGTNLSTTFVEAVSDLALMFPATGTGDDNDCWCIYQDADANALTAKMWDSSAASAIETSTIQTMTQNATDGSGQGGFAGAVRHSDGHIIVVSCSEFDTATADMQCFDVGAVNSASLTGITTKTAITTNIDDNYYPSVFINQANSDIYVAYNGKRDGSEVMATTTKIYYTKSTDGATSWTSGDTAYEEGVAANILQTYSPMMGARFLPVWRSTSSLKVNVVNSLTFAAGPFTSTLTGTLNFVGANLKRTSHGMAGATAFAGACAKRIARLVSGALSYIGALVGTKSSPGGGAFAEVGAGSQRGHKQGTTKTGNVIETLAFPGNVTSGNLLIVWISSYDLSAGNFTSYGVTDTQGTSYTSARFNWYLDATEGDWVGIAYGVAPSSGANTVTVTLTGATTQENNISIIVDEFSGQNATPFSVNGGGAANASSNAPSDPIATLTSGELVCGVMTYGSGSGNATISAGSGYTLAGSEASRTYSTLGASFKIAGAAGTESGQFSLNDARDWACLSLSFKKSATGGPQTSSLSGSLSFVGADMIKTGKGLVGALSFTGAAAKRMSRSLSGALSFVGALAGVRFLVRVFTATLSFVGVQRDTTAKALTASLSFIGATSRAIAHKLSGSLSFIGALAGVRFLVRVFTATLGFVGVQTDRTSKAFTAVLTFAGAMAKRSTRALAGALSFVGAMAKQSARSLSGALSFAGTIRRSIAHQMTAAIAFVGSFATQLIGGAIQYSKSLAAALSFSTIQTKVTARRITGALSFVGAAAKAIPRSFTAALNFVGTFTRAFPRTLTAALSFIGAQSDRTSKTFAAALSFAGAMSKRWARTFAAALAFVGSFKKTSVRLITAAIAFSGTIKRAVAHKMAAALSFAGNFITQLVGGPVHNLLSLTAALLFSGAQSKASTHKMASALSFVGGVGRRLPKILAGALSFIGAVARRNVLNKLLTASLSFVGAQYKATRTALSAATLSFAGVFTKFVPGLALIFRNRRASRGIGI